MKIIIVGVLALNLTLPGVADTRLNNATQYPVTHNPDDYTCLLAVPNGYAEFIDYEAYFAAYDGELHGPMLIVDAEADHHAPFMSDNGLAGDTNCVELVHEKGLVIVWGDNE